MNKYDFPKNEEELENWLDTCTKFNETFKHLIQSLVYLWKVRELVSTEQLSKLCSETSSVLKQICAKECNEDVFSGQTCCPVGKYLNKICNDDRKDSSSSPFELPFDLDFSSFFEVNRKDGCEDCIYSMPVEKSARKHFGFRKVGCTNKARIDHLVNKVAFLVGKKDIRSLIDAKDILEKAIEMQICYGNYGGCECEYVNVEEFKLSGPPLHPSCYFDKNTEVLQNIKEKKNEA